MQAKKNQATSAHNEEKNTPSGKEASQLKSVPPVSDREAQKAANEMATPASPADDKPNADEADRTYAEHSMNPSVGGGSPNQGAPFNGTKNVAPPQKEEVEKSSQSAGAKAGKFFLRVKNTHPRGSFNIGRHTLSRGFQEYDLNEAEAKELQSEGAQAWVEQGDATKAKADAKLQDEIRRAQGGAADDI